MKVGQRNRNLEKLRSIEKDHIHETKAILKRILATNKNIGQVFAGHGRLINKEQFGRITRELGFSLNPEQLEVVLYYIDPTHQGTVTIDKINRAIQNPSRLDDTVSQDLASRRSPSSASTNLSVSSAGTGLRVERLKEELKKRCLDGKIQEEDFREVVRSQMPYLETTDIDRMVDDALSHKESGRKRADNIVTDIYRRAAAKEYSDYLKPSREYSASNFTINSRIQSGNTHTASQTKDRPQQEPQSPAQSSEGNSHK